MHYLIWFFETILDIRIPTPSASSTMVLSDQLFNAAGYLVAYCKLHNKCKTT